MDLPAELEFEDWRPGQPHQSRLVPVAHVPALYEVPIEAGSVMFTWNDCEDPAMIIGVGPDWSVATLMIDGYWYSYVIDEDAEGYVPIDLSNQTCEWPRSELLPRAAALPVLTLIPDLTAIRRGFPWRSQWRHVETEPAPDITV
jgi:hypothetical protein